MTQQKPTIVLSHGLWHRPVHFQPFIDSLQTQGFKVIAPALPSTGGELHHGMLGDAQVIERTIEGLVDAEEDVLVIGHSYSGVVVTEAVKIYQTKKVRSMAEKRGGVLGIIFLCAFVLPPGQSLMAALGGHIPPFSPVDLEGKMVMLHSKERFIYASPPKETEELLALLAPVSINTHTEQLRNCGYLSVPNLYIHAKDDLAIVYPLQKKMVHAAKVLGADFVEETVEAGHDPSLTHPDELAQIVLKHLKAGRWDIIGFTEEEAEVQGDLLGQGMQQIGKIMMGLGEIPGGPQ